MQTGKLRMRNVGRNLDIDFRIILNSSFFIRDGAPQPQTTPRKTPASVPGSCQRATTFDHSGKKRVAVPILILQAANGRRPAPRLARTSAAAGCGKNPVRTRSRG